MIETLSILSILITKYPSFVSSLVLEPQPLKVLTPLLSHPRPAVRKRATITLAQFVPLASANLFNSLMGSEITPNLLSTANIEGQRTTVNLIAALSRTSPQRIASSLGELVPGILKTFSRDDDELKDVSLQVLIHQTHIRWFTE